MAQTKGGLRDGRPDIRTVTLSIERFVCLQSIVYATRVRDPKRIKVELENLKFLETRDFIDGYYITC